MVASTAGNRTLGYALRAAQFLLAIIVLGTDGYAISKFEGRTEIEHGPYGTYPLHYNVPGAWSFLMFCAAWTVLVVIFDLVAGLRFAQSALLGYIGLAAEGIAVISWFAGFIALAVQVSTDTCKLQHNTCGSLTAATVFGALEWLLFMATVAMTALPILNGTHGTHTATARPSAV